jgi:hypothetical protein
MTSTSRETTNTFYHALCVIAAIVVFASALAAQQTQSLQPGTLATTDSDSNPETESKRIFLIIPNYRTVPTIRDFKPLTPGEKFKIATEDSFDRGTFALAALFGGQAQLTNANRAFGQGAAGFGRYFGASFGDFAIGNYMTEAIYPTILHQDTRYFRQGTGTRWSRFGYAVGQIFWTHGDSGRTEFNYSELVGNSTAVAISNAYYSDNRTASNAVSKLGMQIGVDMAGNILKEFWPDFERKFTKRHRNPSESARHEVPPQTSPR